MRRTQPSTKGQNFFITHVQLLQWLHGKQQQQVHTNLDERSFPEYLVGRPRQLQLLDNLAGFVHLQNDPCGYNPDKVQN